VIGIVINTDYHYATGLCLYKILKDLDIYVSFKIFKDLLNFRGLCKKYNLNLSEEEKYDACFVVTDKENNYVPNFSSSVLKSNKLIFINHRPLKNNNITKRFFPNSLNLANGIYESSNSKNYFFQSEYPFTINVPKTESIGIVCNFLNKRFDLDLINSIKNSISLPFKYIGKGSSNLNSDVNYDNLHHLDFFNIIAAQKFFLLPYSDNEYIYNRISEIYTHSIALEIPLICYSKFMNPYGLSHINPDNMIDLSSFNFDNFYREVKEFKKIAAEHNKNIITKYLEML